MSEYYAVQRSDACIAHYGVKGMKWGVKKAIRSGSTKKLDKQYAKALKKVKKLNTKASIKRSNQEAEGRKGLALAGTALVGGGIAGYGTHLVEKATSRAIAVGLGGIPIMTSKLAMGLGAAGVPLVAYQGARYAQAKHRTSPKGHERSVTKAKKFKAEMKKSFSGTKYEKLPGANKMNDPYWGYDSDTKKVIHPMVSTSKPRHTGSKKVKR